MARRRDRHLRTADRRGWPRVATPSAQHDSITFDFGNDDTRSCASFRTPIVGVTTAWSISYTSSGGSGALDPFNRTANFDHDVDEIQTIGREN